MSIASDQAVLVWGEVLWDRFPDGARLGGAPANVAWHLGQAGGWARLISRVGDDADGHAAIAQLEEVCDTELVQLDRERATGEVRVAIEAGEPRYTLVPDRAWQRIECTASVTAAIDAAGVFAYGTLAQLTPDGLAGWRAAISRAKHRCLTVCDVNLRKTKPVVTPPADELVAIQEALEFADVLKVNDRELEVLASWFSWRDPIAHLRERRLIAVTHGARGSTLYTASDRIDVAGVAASPGGDNVGCGDAYLAILVLGLTAGWDLATTGRAAARWAAAVAGVRGATPRFDDARISELLGEAAA
jgi:fructokinase